MNTAFDAKEVLDGLEKLGLPNETGIIIHEEAYQQLLEDDRTFGSGSTPGDYFLFGPSERTIWFFTRDGYDQLQRRIAQRKREEGQIVNEN